MRGEFEFSRRSFLAGAGAGLGGLLLAPQPLPGAPAASPDRWFNTLVAHWTDYADPEYLPFLKEARPEVAQVGFYGATFYSLAHTPFYKGYPAHFPIQGTAECARWFEELNRKVHDLGIRVIGHFNVSFLFGDLEKGTGFFEWYRTGWDEKAWGPRPCADPADMLQKDAEGHPITTTSYRVGGWPEYHGCLNNPLWRACLKAMLKDALRRGVDGLISNYFYRRDCMCRHCQEGFRAYLAAHCSAAELRDRLGIRDLAVHRFTEIPSWHKPAETSPYRMAALTWTQVALKDAYDDVFLGTGKKLKPDLLVGQWNHLGDFAQSNLDERCCLPAESWGKGEDTLWYSTGASADHTDLARGHLGDGTLQLRYLRGAFGARPFLLGKYEQVRTRVTIAEGVANGGAGMGFYAPFKNPAGREALVRYFGFVRRNRDLYHGAEPAGELLLLYPRSAVHAGDVAPVERFRVLGRRLLRDHFAFDVLPDDLLDGERLSRYRAVALCDEGALPGAVKAALKGFRGGRLRMDGPDLPGDTERWGAAQLARVSRAEGAPTVQLSLMAQPERHRHLAHLVNYNREEPPAGARPAARGPQDERPIACENVRVRVRVPAGMRLREVRLLSPDEGTPTGLIPAPEREGQVEFTVPRVLVYTLAVVEWQAG